MAWDPIGRYIASQGDDKRLLIHELDGSLVHECTDVFQKSPTENLFCRLDWSSDGSWIAATRGVKEKLHCAPLFERRRKWQHDREFIGHSKAVTCVRFNPRMYRRPSKPDEVFQICALGSQDCTVSLWATNRPKAVSVTTNAFRMGLLDLSWTPDGDMLFMASGDGSVWVQHFVPGIFGAPLEKSEVIIHPPHLSSLCFSLLLFHPELALFSSSFLLIPCLKSSYAFVSSNVHSSCPRRLTLCCVKHMARQLSYLFSRSSPKHPTCCEERCRSFIITIPFSFPKFNPFTFSLNPSALVATWRLSLEFPRHSTRPLLLLLAPLC